MTTSTITFFPVGNGDMTLLTLADGKRILIDCNIRAVTKDNGVRDVAADLRSRLNRDSKGRPYVDAFLLSHPDTDHCRGIKEHFYLGDPGKYPDDSKTDAAK